MEASNPLTEVRLRTLKGIGEKTEKLFGKVGIDNLDQLVHYYPRAYDACTNPVSLSALRPGEKQAVQVRIQKPAAVKTGGRVPVTILHVTDGSQKLEAVWFNMPYLRSVLKPGSTAVLRGLVRSDAGGRLTMEQPELFSAEAYDAVKGSIRPVYALTAGLRSKIVGKAVAQVLAQYRFSEYLPEELLQTLRLAGRQEALNGIHFPGDETALAAARRRIVFDEFLLYLLKLGRLSADPKGAMPSYAVTDTPFSDRILAGLPYALTGAQLRAWQEIRADLARGRAMNRLLQGDVGSGKTIVAFLALAAMMREGLQSVLMAPTEVLAEQHYAAFVRLLREHGQASEQTSPDAVVLLTGSLTAKEKRQAYEKIRRGEALVVIGTHAVLQEKVCFTNLALVVTDEQHRFGVRQRAVLAGKGSGREKAESDREETGFSEEERAPHVLVMSATPIPRTLALILYGDLDLSVIDELPAQRLRIKNCVVDGSWRKTAYAFMQKEIQGGHQVYVICPMIEENEDLGCENVLEYTKKLKKIFPPEIRVEMLHGRMRPNEKLEVMRAFSENRIQILVSTTVVEVGVDVPNATVMLIENAERFGLAQLHQLRGRIGRGNDQAYCIFLRGDAGEETGKRLEILNRETDGFVIAREDLKLRGQGDLFGLRQSGEAGFVLADPFADARILEEASAAAKAILAEDPALSSEKYRRLKTVLDQTETRLEGVL